MKVLIYYKENELKPIGGPSGYLYNIKNELNKIDMKDIYFIKDDESNTRKKTIKDRLKRIYIKYIPRKIQIRLGFYEKSMRKKIFNSKSLTTNINIDEYDIIHFHSALSMYLIKDSLKNYKGKVLLTSHSPKISHKEMIDGFATMKMYKKNKNYYDAYEVIDEYAFNRADYIIFPTKEAEECYYNTWEKYKTIHQNNRDKYIYIASGINGITIDKSKAEVRKKYGIPDDAFLISYVGRHNEVKGYDHLLEIGKAALNKFENLYFIVGGIEEPLKGLKHERWVEVGWTNRPHDLINSSDLFILPNKETYFDLIFLEVLSVGKTMLVTNTGGNKHFKKYKNAGIFYYDYGNTEEAIKKIGNIISKKLMEYEIINKEIMMNNYTVSIFVKKYIDVLNNICKRDL